jgi:adenosine deaminase/aminodeoxyfutalosine deaminase
MQILSERQVPVEVCISSNLRTGCCPALEQHPVRRYFDSGVMVTLNSDDPAMFESDLENEYRLAHDAFGFTPEHLRELAANSVEASFLPAGRKVDLLHQIEQVK